MKQEQKNIILSFVDIAVYGFRSACFDLWQLKNMVEQLQRIPTNITDASEIPEFKNLKQCYWFQKYCHQYLSYVYSRVGGNVVPSGGSEEQYIHSRIYPELPPKFQQISSHQPPTKIHRGTISGANLMLKKLHFYSRQMALVAIIPHPIRRGGGRIVRRKNMTRGGREQKFGGLLLRGRGGE